MQQGVFLPACVRPVSSPAWRLPCGNQVQLFSFCYCALTLKSKQVQCTKCVHFFDLNSKILKSIKAWVKLYLTFFLQHLCVCSDLFCLRAQLRVLCLGIILTLLILGGTDMLSPAVDKLRWKARSQPQSPYMCICVYVFTLPSQWPVVYTFPCVGVSFLNSFCRLHREKRIPGIQLG